MSLFSVRSRSPFSSQRSGFTLIELMIALAIFAIMMLAAFEVYVQVMSLSRRLELQREVQQSARVITEAIAKEVREQGFIITQGAGSNSDIPSTPGIYYTGSGLLIATGSAGGPTIDIGFYPQDKDGAPCDPTNPNNICALVKKLSDGGSQVLSSDRVRLSHLRFEQIGENLSGSSGAGGGINVGISNVAKVRMTMTLEPKAGNGISQGLIDITKLHIDTVFSSKIYKSN